MTSSQAEEVTEVPVLSARGITVPDSVVSMPSPTSTSTWRRGSIAGLVGPNGAGKTTMLGVLSGFCVQRRAGLAPW